MWLSLKIWKLDREFTSENKALTFTSWAVVICSYCYANVFNWIKLLRWSELPITLCWSCWSVLSCCLSFFRTSLYDCWQKKYLRCDWCMQGNALCTSLHWIAMHIFLTVSKLFICFSVGMVPPLSDCFWTALKRWPQLTELQMKSIAVGTWRWITVCTILFGEEC